MSGSCQRPRTRDRKADPWRRARASARSGRRACTAGRVSVHAKPDVQSAIETADIGANTASAADAASGFGSAAISSSTTAPVPASPCSRPIPNASRGVRSGRSWSCSRLRWTQRTSTRSASRMITTPTAVSAVDSSTGGSAVPSRISGRPMSSSAVAWPAPQTAPRRAAERVPRSSRATSAVTAIRWSGSVAWRRPSRKATPSATASGAPSKRLERDSSRCSTGAKRKSRSIIGRPRSPGRRRRAGSARSRRRSRSAAWTVARRPARSRRRARTWRPQRSHAA